MFILQDAEPIKCLAFHPGGEHLIVGTNHPVVRLYDVNTAQCFVCSIPSHQHTATVINMKYIFKLSHFCPRTKLFSISKDFLTTLRYLQLQVKTGQLSCGMLCQTAVSTRSKKHMTVLKYVRLHLQRMER